PVNTGLGFTTEEIEKLPSHTLPLFSESALCWSNEHEISGLVARVAAIRRQWHDIVVNPSHETMRVFETTDPRVLCYTRLSPDGERALAVVANTDCANAAEASVWLDSDYDILTDEISGAEIGKNDQDAFILKLEPGQGMVFELRAPKKLEIEEFEP
ncbi:MAG: hypothetical protein JXA28_05420, partial [Bacteroidetes bacterium]|nr:hypothetical protein [Bacteroidota bacterium]